MLLDPSSGYTTGMMVLLRPAGGRLLQRHRVQSVQSHQECNGGSREKEVVAIDSYKVSLNAGGLLDCGAYIGKPRAERSRPLSQQSDLSRKKLLMRHHRKIVAQALGRSRRSRPYRLGTACDREQPFFFSSAF